VDPLQRAIEINGRRFECTEIGARGLEEFLNTTCAPPLLSSDDNVIEVKENAASSTGFDVHFVTVHSGLRLDIKGHLNQDRLDLLQDPNKCDLMQPGILMRLSPPHLLIRRRRPDGGEERIPGLPDISYLHITAPELQRVLNHPLIRRGGGPAPAAVVPSTPAGQELAPPPVTAPPVPGWGPDSHPATVPATPAPPPPAPAPARPPALPPPPAMAAAVAAPPVKDPFGVETLASGEAAAASVDREIFLRLAGLLELPIQDVRLSLPRVFENRQFEVLSFSHDDVTDLGDLRSVDFYGFYLTHVDAGNVILVYACDGHHVEFGAHKCVLQSGLDSEPTEFKGPALLGLAQDADDNFVFVVSRRYREWAEGQAKHFLAVHARFLTREGATAEPGVRWIWPETPAE
jgi:hypothetical protein